MTYFVMIMCSIILFLFVLALYRLHTLDEIEREHKEKVEKLKYKILTEQEENAKLRTFKVAVDNLVVGNREDKEVREKIKELLYK